MLGKTYSIILVVIVSNYSVFVSKASVRMIDKTKVMAQFKTIGTE